MSLTAIKDSETVLRRLLDILQSATQGLNFHIAAINAEKNDGITLASIDSGAFYHMLGELPNDTVFCLAEVVDWKPVNNNNFNGNDLKVNIQICFYAENVNSVSELYKSMRYIEAIKRSMTGSLAQSSDWNLNVSGYGTSGVDTGSGVALLVATVEVMIAFA